MTDKIRKTDALPRAACLIGAVFDALALLPMLVPSLGGRLFGLEHFSPRIDYRYAMNVAAALMAGWTLLLLWAALRPVERRAVLGLTAVVVAGLMLAGGGAVVSGFIPLRKMLPVLVSQATLFLLFLAGLLRANRLTNSGVS